MLRFQIIQYSDPCFNFSTTRLFKVRKQEKCRSHNVVSRTPTLNLITSNLCVLLNFINLTTVIISRFTIMGHRHVLSPNGLWNLAMIITTWTKPPERCPFLHLMISIIIRQVKCTIITLLSVHLRHSSFSITTMIITRFLVLTSPSLTWTKKIIREKS